MRHTIFAALVILALSIFSNYAFAQRWEQAALPAGYANNYWLDVYFMPSNPQLGWISGRQGKVLRTYDGGNSWIGTAIVGIDTLESVDFPTPLVGYVSGPGGIFRSTDGGVSWRSIKPDSARELWGCYFISADTGVVIGGGCADKQQFFRTTDGGSSWTMTTANLRSSGLTDAILLSSNGRGYAVSSGYLWVTNNGGATWDVLCSTGEKYWQEELCLYGNSFLLPFAGVTCSGSGGGGGMRFSRNSGNTWTEFQTGALMFGAFLLNDSTGWAVGVKQNIWYTSNYGATWELRNCGLGAVDFDDIWMINENSGWAVGSAVYKLAPPFRSITRTSLDFGETCYPGSRFDTLYIKVTSFSSTIGSLLISGKDSSDFSILEPSSSNFTVRSCDSVRVVVKFTPSATADAAADLSISMLAPFSTQFVVPLAGKGQRVVSRISDSVLNMGNRPCGRFSYDSIIFVNPSADPETITWIDHLNVRDEIRPIGNIPAAIPPGGREKAVVFRSYFTDTGTVVNTYRFWIGACPQFFTVKATGYSPIITMPFARSVGLACKPEQFDTLMISNTGNAPLRIEDIRIAGQDAKEFSLVGWADGASLLRTIMPKKSAGLVVKFAPSSSGQKKMQLLVKNNDSTTIRGDRTTALTLYQGGVAGSSVKLVSADSVSGGLLCPGSQSTQRVIVRNIGGSSAFLSQISSLKPGIRTSIVSGQLPREIKNGDSLALTVFFDPLTVGEVTDTLTMKFEPCGEIIRVVLSCERITTQLTVAPDTISGIIQAGAMTQRKVTLRSIGTDAAIISSITLKPARTDWRLSSMLKLPFTLAAGSDTTVTIEFMPTRDTMYSGSVCFAANELCYAVACAPIAVTATDIKLDISVAKIDFPDNICNNPTRAQQFTITNRGSLPDTITELSITSGAADFVVVSPKPPIALKSGELTHITIECRQQNEGVAIGELAIRSAKGKNTLFTMPLQAKYANSKIIADQTGVFFGEVDQCDTTRSIRVRVSNQGTLKETVSVTRLGAVPIFSISPSDSIDIPPGGVIYLDILCDPSAASLAGLYTEYFLVKGTICEQKFIIPTAVNIVKPMLTIVPDSLSYGVLISGDDSIKKIYVSNKGERQVVISSITLESGTQGFSIVSTPNLPRVLQPDQTDSILVNFHANQTGLSNDKLLINGGSICSSLKEVPLAAETNNQVYESHVFIKKYDVQPDDTLAIPIEMQGSIDDAIVRSIAVRIAYDTNLFLLNNITADSLGYKIKIQHTSDTSGVSFVLNNSGNVKLGKSGAVATMHGIALYSVPDTTTLKISQFTLQARRRVTITHTDGFLQSRSSCGLLIGFVLRPIVNAVVLNNGSGSAQTITAVLHSNAATKAAIVLRNIFGEPIFSDNRISVDQYGLEYSIDASQIPSGAYFLEVSSSGITEGHPIVVVK